MTRPTLYAWLAMGALLIFDQAVKIWVRAEIPMFRSTELIPNLIDLTHVENKGVSFSFLGSLNDGVRLPLLVGVSLVAIGLLVYFWWSNKSQFNTYAHLAFVLILPGAVGNLIDRAVYGTVTDYFHFRFFSTSFFVNNLADIFISAGVVAYIIGMLKDQSKGNAPGK